MIQSASFVVSAKQWHLFGPAGGAACRGLDVNIPAVWDDYTGAGVRTAVIDDGFAYTHVALAANYDTTGDYDFRFGDTDAAAEKRDMHGTAVAGIIAANSPDAMGISPEATILGLRIGFDGDGTVDMLAAAIRASADADSMNGSWSFRGAFADNFTDPALAAVRDALAYAATEGRDGLGTALVVAAGNARETGDDVNHHNVQNSIYTIAVGSYAEDGTVSRFSNPGAALMVSAPGEAIWTTDVPGKQGYSFFDEGYFSGTSAAAPFVTGIVNLMLEANAGLGARDVQEILAYSARPMPAAPGAENGAADWNGGGLLFSDKVGFGAADAHAAVRLAEVWDGGATFDNMATVTASSNHDVALGASSVQLEFHVSGTVRLDRVELALDLDHERLSDLRVVLISPDGTRSVLLNTPPVADEAGMQHLDFSVTSNAFWSELSEGTWQLRVQDRDGTDATGVLHAAELRLHGDAPNADDTYVYTDAFADLAGRSRLLSDTNGGTDTLSCAALSEACQLDLRLGATQLIAGRSVTLGASGVIENALGGDGGDRIIGNAAANLIWGGRGDDTVSGGGGTDDFAFGVHSGHDSILDFAAGDRVILTAGVGVAALDGSKATLSDGAIVTAANGWVWSAADFEARDGLWA